MIKQGPTTSAWYFSFILLIMTMAALACLSIAVSVGKRQQIEHRQLAEQLIGAEQAHIALTMASNEIALGENAIAAKILLQIPTEHRQLEWGFLFSEADSSCAAIPGRGRIVMDLAFNPTGKELASASSGFVYRWDVETLQLIRQYRADSTVHTVAYHSDGEQLLAGTDSGTIFVWKQDSFEKPRRIPVHEAAIKDLTFNSVGTLLATASFDGTVAVLDAKSFDVLHHLDMNQRLVYCVDFTSDGLLVVGTQRDIQIWRLDSAEPVLDMRIPNGASGIACSPDDSTVYGIGSSLTKYDQNVEHLLRTVPGHEPRLNMPPTHTDLLHHPRRPLLVTSGMDRTIRFWESNMLNEVAILAAHSASVSSLAFNADGSMLASGAYDGEIRLWRTNEQIKWLVPFNTPNSGPPARISRDGRLIAFKGGELHNFDIESGQSTEIDTEAFRSSDALGLSADGSLLAIFTITNEGSEVQVRNVDTGEMESRFQVNEKIGSSVRVILINGIRFARHGRRLASYDSDAKIRIWHVDEPEAITVLSGPDSNKTRSVDFSPDGLRLVSCAENDSSVYIWDLDRGKLAKTITEKSAIRSAVFSPDGRYIAYGIWKSGFRIIDAHTGDSVVFIPSPTTENTFVIFSPDGRRLITASENIIRFWDAANGRKLLALQGHRWPISWLGMDDEGKYLLSADAKSLRVWRNALIE